MSHLDIALEYLKKGWPIIPIIKGKKKPPVEWTPFQTRFPTEAEVREWWTKWPDAGIAIPTGLISGMSVIDLDSDEAKEWFNNLLPDSLSVPTVTTPRGGLHFHFKHPHSVDLRGHNGEIHAHVDLKANGNYIIMPPTVGHEGPYKWLNGYGIEALQSMPSFPEAYLSLCISLIDKNRIKVLANVSQPGVSQDVTNSIFTEGKRNDSLFHVVNTLARGGEDMGIAFQVLVNLGKTCNPPMTNERELRTIFESAFKRQEDKNRNLTAEIQEWVSVTSGYFAVTSCYNALHCVTKTEKATVRQALNRLKQQGIIEKFGTKDGEYRRIDPELQPLDLMIEDDTKLQVSWPFEIENMVFTLPKTIIIVAGSPDAGKTAFLLNFAAMNRNYKGVRYLSSEMGVAELRSRTKKIEIDFDEWSKIGFYNKSSDFHDGIDPNGINIIDYLEISKDMFNVGEMIKKIYDKLDQGIAVIALQKKRGMELGRGAEFSLEKARLYLTIDRDEDGNYIRIVKAKNWVDETRNPNGSQNRFKLYKGCQFFPDGWMDPDALAELEKDRKYKGFKK